MSGSDDQAIANAGSAAFWRAVAGEAERRGLCVVTGDLRPDASLAFDVAALAAVTAWLDENDRRLRGAHWVVLADEAGNRITVRVHGDGTCDVTVDGETYEEWASLDEARRTSGYPNLVHP